MQLRRGQTVDPSHEAAAAELSDMTDKCDKLYLYPFFMQDSLLKSCRFLSIEVHRHPINSKYRLVRSTGVIFHTSIYANVGGSVPNRICKAKAEDLFNLYTNPAVLLSFAGVDVYCPIEGSSHYASFDSPQFVIFDPYSFDASEFAVIKV